jgi:hypothetical protein
MELATGMSGGKPFAVIDTESGRARHYAETFAFDHAEIRAPFRPETYLDAIIAAEAAGYGVVVVDSVSHVWAGDGGILDWQEEELDRMAGDDWKKREACKMAAWIKPKMAHKQMVQRLLQMRSHVILCFRAEPKIEMIREDGRVKIVAKKTPTSLEGWIPICEKMLPYELTASFLLLAEAPGIPKPIKLQEQHRALVPVNKTLSRESGKLLAEWALGGVAKPQPQASDPAPRSMDALTFAGDAIAPSGPAALEKWWKESLTKAERVLLKDKLPTWKTAAEKAQ